MSSSEWLSPAHVAVLELVAERAGLRPPSCLAAAREGIERARARAGFGDLEAYLRRLPGDRGLMDELLVQLTVGETYFFRTPEHFTHLRQHVLPEVARRRGPYGTLRAWSAGCSSGEEAWSLAITLLEEGFGEHMDVLATDVSRAALERARLARYGPWSLRSPEAEHVRPWLRQEGSSFVVIPELRERVRFALLNLAEPSWPSPSTVQDVDVLFCRNVFIYLHREAVAAVALRLYASLAEGGFLFTGPSDPYLGGLAPLEVLPTPWGLLYRRPQGAPARLPPPSPAPVAEPLPASPGLAPRTLTGAPLLAPVPAAAAVDLEAVRQALTRGDWRQAAERVGALQEVPQAAAQAVRTLANLSMPAAVRASAEARTRHPLSPELRYVEALLLLGLGKLQEAERSVRQALYLQPSLVVAHLTLGHLLRRQGDTQGALRSFRSAEALCAALPPEAPVPLSEGESAGSLARVARELCQQREAAHASKEVR